MLCTQGLAAHCHTRKSWEQLPEMLPTTKTLQSTHRVYTAVVIQLVQTAAYLHTKSHNVCTEMVPISSSTSS
jgi:hypothetical protein